MLTQKRKTLEGHEVTRLLTELHDRKSKARDYFLVRFLLNTGLRVGELVGLDVGDVQGRQAVTVRGKGGKTRTVALNKGARELVATFLHWKKRTGEGVGPDAPLLVSRQRQRLAVRSVQDLLDKAARRVGIGGGKVTPHTLRRTFATAVYGARGIMAAKTLLGHSFVNTTQLYVKSDEIEAAEAVEAISF